MTASRKSDVPADLAESFKRVAERMEGVQRAFYKVGAALHTPLPQPAWSARSWWVQR